MGDPFHDRPFPRGALLGATALVGLTLLGVGSGRLFGVGVVATPEPAPAASRELRFEDRDDGAVLVRDGGDDGVIAVLEPGQEGFIRGVLRGLARERRSHHVGPEPPFLLLRSSTGELFLEDPQTGRRISLDAFGPTNSGAFARLLEAAPESISAAATDQNAQGG
jgi:putative photosynthetic complex assembly protein